MSCSIFPGPMLLFVRDYRVVEGCWFIGMKLTVASHSFFPFPFLLRLAGMSTAFSEPLFLRYKIGCGTEALVCQD